MQFLNLFFMYSILGFTIESLLALITNPSFNSGMLRGPWTPLYGIGIIIIYLVNKKIKKWNLKKWQEIILYFFIITIILTILEFICGNLIYLLLDKTYWNYTKLKFNLGKYIALEISLIWGIGATLINYLLLDKSLKIAKKIPLFITIILSILFLGDIIYYLLERF